MQHSFFHSHQVIITLVSYYVGSSFVSSLPAPTKDSSQAYVFLFRFANTLGANLARAYSSTVEKSPNFQDAVDKHVASGN